MSDLCMVFGAFCCVLISRLWVLESYWVVVAFFGAVSLLMMIHGLQKSGEAMLPCCLLAASHFSCCSMTFYVLVCNCNILQPCAVTRAGVCYSGWKGAVPPAAFVLVAPILWSSGLARCFPTHA